jgi:hypothetical protein
VSISTHQVAPIESAQAALTFITAGNAHFTLVSKQTGKRYTYRVRRGEQPNSPLFASVLYGQDNASDYRYVGVVRDGQLAFTAKSKVTCDDPRGAGLQWALGKMATKGEIPAQLEVWHEGRCGRCARRLTDPASISRGLGPECSGKVA